MESALIDRLLSIGGVTALVSNRIHWKKRPQGSHTLPCIILQKVSGDRLTTNDGPDYLVESRVQFNCLAADYLGAITVRNALRVALSGARFWQSGVQFQGCLIDLDGDLLTDDIAGAEIIEGVRQDFIFWHSE